MDNPPLVKYWGDISHPIPLGSTPLSRMSETVDQVDDQPVGEINETDEDIHEEAEENIGSEEVEENVGSEEA